jgi:2-methylcitrate dehydratase PrpD
LVLQGYFKPFAAVRHVHYGAQAALSWRAAFDTQTQSITAIRLQTYPEAVIYCGNRTPANVIQAQFSLTYGLTHALARGSLGPKAYDLDTLADDEIRRLESLVVVDDTARFSTGRGAHLTITRDGAETSVEVDRVDGDPDQPMAPDDVVAKFERFAAPRLGALNAAALANRIVYAPLDQSLVDVLNGA